ncbi:hypothetical protein TIFTF001_009318 [Ficus carica]|uniref:Bet1-like protein n=1 Tax=Ficus carica TaxID=3494 RepID=A0AA88CYU4_FICCA|nr:hypothetical protein TIFTF001_009318 [Ficus carica]
MAAYGGAAPFRSREGLSTRAVAGSDEIQLRIDPMQGDLDDEISGLHNQVRRLRYVAEEIGTEAKFQNDFLNQLAIAFIVILFRLRLKGIMSPKVTVMKYS